MRHIYSLWVEDNMDADGIIAMISVMAVVVPILIAHERRLTRIESKIDTIMELIRNGFKA